MLELFQECRFEAASATLGCWSESGAGSGLNAAGSRSRGLSIIELLVTLAVASILMGIGAPGLSHFIKNNRLNESAYGMLGTINLARSEAVKRRVRVVLCRSANPQAATPTCGGSDKNWTTGWLVFASGDTNDTYEAGIDTLIGIGTLHSGGITVKSNVTSNDKLEYNPDGTTNEGGDTAAFAFCDNRGGGYGKRIEVPPHGRPRFMNGNVASPIECVSPA